MIFGHGYPLFEKLHNADYLGTLKLPGTLGIAEGVFGLIVIAAAIVMFWLGEKAERRFKRDDIMKEV